MFIMVIMLPADDLFIQKNFQKESTNAGLFLAVILDFDHLLNQYHVEN